MPRAVEHGPPTDANGPKGRTVNPMKLVSARSRALGRVCAPDKTRFSQLCARGRILLQTERGANRIMVRGEMEIKAQSPRAQRAVDESRGRIWWIINEQEWLLGGGKGGWASVQ